MPSTLNPNIPGGLEQIIMKAMSREPAGRYTSATAMLYDMDEFRKNPIMLFDYNTPPLDDVTRIHSAPLVVDVPKTTAERVVAGKTDAAVPRRAAGTPQRRSGTAGAPQHRTTTGTSQRRASSGSGAASPRSRTEERRRREEERQAESRSQMATIAIIAGSAVAILALIVLLWAVVGGGFSAPKEDLVEVPNLIGEIYEQLDLDEYDGLNIDLLYRQFSDEFAEGQIMHQEPSGGVKVQRGNTVKVIVSSGPETPIKTMENLSGLDLQTAKNYLIGQGVLSSNILDYPETSADVPKGQVIRTEPAEGEEFTSDSTVKVWVSTGPDIEEGTLPNVVGKNLEVAYNILVGLNFKNIHIENVESDAPEGEVISQSIEANQKIDVTTLIILEVSEGPKVEKMPDLSGKTYEEAVKILNDLGFMDVEPEEVDSTKMKGQVVGQSVEKDKEIEVLTAIVLKVSKGYKMPDAVGKSFDAIQRELSDRGYINIKPDFVNSDQPDGTILEQRPGKDTQIDENTEIVLTVSIGPAVTAEKKTITIDVTDLGITESFTLELWEKGEPHNPMTYEAGTTTVTIKLEGYGKVEYEIWINEICVKDVTIDFSDGQPTMEIKVP
jgi:beta-lactam-binding protein with PASTA domain